MRKRVFGGLRLGKTRLQKQLDSCNFKYTKLFRERKTDDDQSVRRSASLLLAYGLRPFLMMGLIYI